MASVKPARPHFVARLVNVVSMLLVALSVLMSGYGVNSERPEL